MTGARNLPLGLFKKGLAAAVLNLALSASSATAWPIQNVRIVTPSAAGSGMDAVTRMLAEGFSKRWSRAVVVENQPGADGILAVRGFLQNNNGHALLFTTHSTITINPLLHADLPYVPKRDLSPIALAVEDFLSVVASPSLPANSLKELVSLASSKPGGLNYIASPGSPSLAFAGFQAKEGIKLTFVPTRSPIASLPDIVNGRIEIGVLPLGAVIGLARENKVKVLAITNGQRSPQMPNIPTSAESGFPDFGFAGFLGLFGPADMALDRREQIAKDMRSILLEPETLKRLANFGLVANVSTPVEFEALLEQQRNKWEALAKAHAVQPK